jgi:hypothetical protein
MHYFESGNNLLDVGKFGPRKFLAKKSFQICCFGKYCLYLSSNREMKIGYFKFYQPWKTGNTRIDWR